MTNDIEQGIFAFIRGRFPDVELAVDDDIFAAGFVNSLFAMELVLFLESAFSITIPNEELNLDNCRSVAAMTRLVHRAKLVPQESQR